MSLSDTLLPDVVQRNFLVKVLLGVILIVALTGGVGVFFYQGISDDLNDQADRQVEATAAQHGNATANWLDNVYDNVYEARDELNSGEDPDQMTAEELWTVLQNLEGQYPQISEIYYVGLEDGTVIGASTLEYTGENFYDSGFSAEDMQGERFILPSQFESFSGDSVMAIGTADIPRGDGVIVVEIGVVDSEGPQWEHGYEGGRTGIVTANDETLLGNNPALAMPDSVDTSGYSQAESSSDIYGYHPVPGYENLLVVTETPKSSAFELRSNVLRNFGLTLGVAFIILFAVTIVGGRAALSDLNRLASRAEEMGEGDLDVDLETTRKDEIGVLYDTFDQMRTDLKTRIREAEEARDEAQSARKEAEVARKEAEQLADYLQQKAEEYSEVMQEVSMGDMTQRMESDGEVDAMDDIAEEFNDMIVELEKTTGQLKSYVNEVEQAGAEVGQSADTVRQASEQVADSIQKISDDAYNQKERLQEVSETMNQILDDLETLAAQEDVDIDRPLSNIREISDDINDIAELSEETMAESEHVAGAAEEQAAELNEVSERANDLQRYAQPLRDILERFETEAEHEFVFSVGPTGGSQSPGTREEDE
jgi:methyl-accepting chemotaxis protein